MANDLNQCNFIGRLGKDPEVKYTPTGMAVCNISIAVGYKYKETEKTEWVSVVFFNKLAEIAGEYLLKGSKIFITGRMQTDKWQDKNGNDRYTTKIIANNMQMLDGKKQEQPRQQEPSQAPNQEPAFDDSDIPF